MVELPAAAENMPVIMAILQTRVILGVNIFMHTEKAYIYGTLAKLSTLSTCLCTIFVHRHVDFFVEIPVYISFPHESVFFDFYPVFRAFFAFLK